MGPQRQTAFPGDRNSNTHRLGIKTHRQPSTPLSFAHPRLNTARIAATTFTSANSNKKFDWKSLRTNNKGKYSWSTVVICSADNFERIQFLPNFLFTLPYEEVSRTYLFPIGVKSKNRALPSLGQKVNQVWKLRLPRDESECFLHEARQVKVSCKVPWTICPLILVLCAWNFGSAGICFETTNGIG